MCETKVATILFTYNRPRHTEAVLNGLKNNSVKPSFLYVFHDGKKESTNLNDWNEVERIIRNITWCDCAVESHEENWGLADSVIYGVNEVFKKYDSLIVLEDDCVPHRLFMEYMITALEKYKAESNVFCIGASSEPVDVPPNGYDAYFIGRINSCGWATWKNKWKTFERDYRLLGKIKKNSDLKKWYKLWGQDIEPTLYGDINGVYDTWAAFWALSVMKHKGLCLAPYYSFIDNIGFDGTGRHSGSENPSLNLLSKGKANILLPDEVKVVDDYERVFANYYPWTDPAVRERYYKNVMIMWHDATEQGKNLSDLLRDRGLKRICIWGLGDVGKRVVAAVGKCQIDAIIESSPDAQLYENIKIICPNEVSSMIDEIDGVLVVPGYDIERISRLVDSRTRDKLITVDTLF